MNHFESQYKQLVSDILLTGNKRDDRTGVGTISSFSPRPLRFNLRAEFPLLTTKRIPFRWVVEELLWFLSGDSNIKRLEDAGVGSIWSPWADDDGNVGPLYPTQFSRQLPGLIWGLLNDPMSRRHVMSMWQHEDIPDMCLPPCHGTVVQFYVERYRDCSLLNCHMYQRSADVFIGLPWNIASYALLTHLVALHTAMIPQMLIITLGDAHIYKNHVAQCHELLSREPKDSPSVTIVDRQTIWDHKASDFKLHGYKPHPAIKAEVAV